MRTRRLVTAIASIQWPVLCWTAEASTAEQRKAEYRQLVMDNYGDPEFFLGCKGFEEEWVGVSTNERMPAQTCSGKDSSRKRNFEGTNYLFVSNAGPVVFAYEGMPIPEVNVEILKCRALLEDNNSSVRDFDLIMLIRILFLGDESSELTLNLVTFLQEQYDIGSLRLWLTQGEPQNYYWTENHMLLYLSSTHLLRDRIQLRDTDDAVINIDSRLRHYLTTKIEYGYYEFFSSNYMPVTLAGLLNLVDFCSDPELVALAEQATTRLVQDYLRFTNAAGYFYPVAGRNKVHQYDAPFPFLSYVLTGNGPPVNDHVWRAERWIVYPITSRFDFDTAAMSWELEINSEFTVGHSIEDHKTVHADESRIDRTLYQWSAGAVLQPEVILDSLYLVNEARAPAVLGSGFFTDVLIWFLNIIPSFLLTFVTSIFPGQTRGTDFSGARYHVYKHNNAMLTSLQDYHVGYRGQEQYPWAATVHDIPVFTLSGIDGDCIVNTVKIANTHLPRVQQVDNIALITYKPSTDVRVPFRLFGWATGFSLRVSLYFPVDRFDEVVERGNWIIGRRVDSYVAIWRDNPKRKKTCREGDSICDEYWFSDGDLRFKASAWAAVVGDSDTHESFSNFVSVVEAGTVTKEPPPLILDLFGSKYTTKVKVDGKEITSSL